MCYRIKVIAALAVRNTHRTHCLVLRRWHLEKQQQTLSGPKIGDPISEPYWTGKPFSATRRGTQAHLSLRSHSQWGCYLQHKTLSGPDGGTRASSHVSGSPPSAFSYRLPREAHKSDFLIASAQTAKRRMKTHLRWKTLQLVWLARDIYLVLHGSKFFEDRNNEKSAAKRVCEGMMSTALRVAATTGRFSYPLPPAHSLPSLSAEFARVLTESTQETSTIRSTKSAAA